MEKGRIETLIELFQLLVLELLTAGGLVEILIVAVLHHLVHPLAEIVHFIDVYGA